MTIKELKEIIKDLPDDMLVGSSGHFGEYLQCFYVLVDEVTEEHSYIKKIYPKLKF